jgi:hypothetical protein
MIGGVVRMMKRIVFVCLLLLVLASASYAGASNFESQWHGHSGKTHHWKGGGR